MVEIPERLECLYTAQVEERDGSYVIEVPTEEVEGGDVSVGEVYRVVALASAGSDSQTGRRETRSTAGPTNEPGERTPPVEAGEVREVTIETLGDRGDGIAKVERGYVVIVPGTEPGEEVTVEIEQVRENVAFARVDTDVETETDTPLEEVDHASTDAVDSVHERSTDGDARD